jgi:hypothetical protein
VGRIARFLKAGKYAERVGAGAPVLRRSGADVSVASVENQHGVDAGHAVKIVVAALISD